MRRVLGIAALCALVGLVALADDLMPRVQRFLDAGQPDLALAALEEHEQRVGKLGENERFLMARLQPNAERFDRQAADLAGGRDAEDELGQAIAFERAREQFARGQYLSALELLRGLPLSAESRFPELLLYRAMAAQAVGEQRSARQDLEAVPSRHPQYAMARVLLADLLLRSREAAPALDAAEAALSADDELVGAQALFLKAQALEQLGRADDALETKREILRDHRGSAEAAGLRGSALPSESSSGREIPEEAAPERRQDFALQLGAFRDRALALRHAERLREQLSSLRIEYDLNSSPAWYRVVLGNYPTRNAAEEMQRQLSRDGIESSLLVPGRGAP